MTDKLIRAVEVEALFDKTKPGYPITGEEWEIRLRALLAEAQPEEPGEVEPLRKELRDWEEREALVCPEDVGFEEYIPALIRRAEKAESALAARPVEAQAEVGEADTLLDEAEDWHREEHPDLAECGCPVCALFARLHTLPAPNAGLREAFKKMRDASFQDHSSHWDSTMQHGAGCPECQRAIKLRNEAQAMWDAALTRGKGGGE